ncbi:MAG: ATP-binding cassette domain-containing protein [Mycoplasmoidaceae bacterium]|nr:ATP-binding cassette domain-containing protein [Mycoplasmoidaceae bacterium]
MQNDVTLLVMFTMIARNLTNPLNQLISCIGQLMLCLVSADRVFQVLEQPEEQDPENAIILDKTKINGVVEAKHMDFGYEPGKPILKNINFVAKPGTITALVGPTGAGKTTIVNLITKFYDINGGDLLIDGKSIKDIDRYSLRENITMVLQDTYLFGTTIRENIRYGRLNATKKEIIEAAKLANCHDFITKLPKGYDTILTDNGENLSQGQRQLLAIARAFLADSKIVILDEATSSIDTKTEIQIQTAMERLIKNRTTFMIAHRLSTIRDADNILVINQGKIVEHGKHNELIKAKGFYYDLYMSQFRGKQI